jgi:hypothetical protein
MQAGDELRAFAEQADAEAVAAMVKRGLRVQVLTAKVEAAWQRQAQQAYPLIRGHTVPAPIFDDALRLIDEYRRAAKRP